MRVAITYLIIVSVLLGLSFSHKHPYHVSVTEIKYNEKDKLLELSCKLFAEDIETALKMVNAVSVDVAARKDSSKVHSLLEAYFKKRLVITLDSMKAEPKFLGFEKTDDVVWCYLEYTDIKPFHKMCVENTILYDFISEQTNMMHFMIGDVRKSKKLNNPDAFACFD